MKKFTTTFTVKTDDSLAVRIYAAHQVAQQRHPKMTLAQFIRNILMKGMAQIEHDLEVAHEALTKKH